MDGGALCIRSEELEVGTFMVDEAAPAAKPCVSSSSRFSMDVAGVTTSMSVPRAWTVVVAKALIVRSSGSGLAEAVRWFKASFFSVVSLEAAKVWSAGENLPSSEDDWELSSVV